MSASQEHADFAAMKPTGLAGYLEYAHKEIGELERAITSLGERLQPLSRPATDDVNRPHVVADPRGAQSDLATQVVEVSIRVRRCTDALEAMTARLEL